MQMATKAQILGEKKFPLLWERLRQSANDTWLRQSKSAMGSSRSFNTSSQRREDPEGTGDIQMDEKSEMYFKKLTQGERERGMPA